MFFPKTDIATLFSTPNGYSSTTATTTPLG